MTVGQALHDGVQGLAVPLLEGRTLGLAVVGQYDQIVGAGRIWQPGEESFQLVVGAPQGVEGVWGGDTGVVGHLVVADEIDVGRRYPPCDVGHQDRPRDLGQDDGGGGAEQRIDPASIEARHHAVAPGPSSGPSLSDDVDDAQGDDAKQGVGGGQHVEETIPSPRASCSPC